MAICPPYYQDGDMTRESESESDSDGRPVWESTGRPVYETTRKVDPYSNEDGREDKLRNIVLKLFWYHFDEGS